MDAPQTVPGFPGLWPLTDEHEAPSTTGVDPFQGCGVHFTSEDQKRHLGKGSGRTHYPDGFQISRLRALLSHKDPCQALLEKCLHSTTYTKSISVGITFRVLSLSHITFPFL